MNKPLCQLCQSDMKKRTKTNWILALFLIALGVFTLPFGIFIIAIGLYFASVKRDYWMCKSCGYIVQRQAGFFRN